MRSKIFSKPRYIKIAVSMALFIVLVGSLSGLYLANRPSPSPSSSATANVISPSASANQLVGSQLQEAISNANSKLPSVSSNVALINSRGLSGVVAGFPLSTMEIAERMNSFEFTALEPKMLSAMQSAGAGESVGSMESSVIDSIVAQQDTYLNESLSNTVLDMMLLAEARAANNEVPYAQASSQAQANYAAYLKAGSPPLRLLHGKTPKGQFVSSGAIKALQDGLTITKMRNQIGGPQYGPKGQNNQRPGLVVWMAANLGKFPITITNSPVPAAELPKYLPATM